MRGEGYSSSEVPLLVSVERSLAYRQAIHRLSQTLNIGDWVVGQTDWPSGLAVVLIESSYVYMYAYVDATQRLVVDTTIECLGSTPAAKAHRKRVTEWSDEWRGKYNKGRGAAAHAGTDFIQSIGPANWGPILLVDSLTGDSLLPIVESDLELGVARLPDRLSVITKATSALLAEGDEQLRRTAVLLTG